MTESKDYKYKDISSELGDPREQDPLVEEVVKYMHAGEALDIGAGMTGRDAFYLAEAGFNVTATEIDSGCMSELRRRNKEAREPLTIIETDIQSYTPDRVFDVVVCDMVLHFLAADEIVPAIRSLQEWTKPGGYNVIMAYTTSNQPGKRPYLFKPNELAEYYKDWEVLRYAEEPTPWFHLPGEPAPRRNEAVYLLARKNND